MSGISHSEIVQFSTYDQWVIGRDQSIGSSEAATVIGYGYAGTSKYALWAEKVHGVRRPLPEAISKKFAKAKAAEPYLASVCQIDHGWDVQFDPPFSFRRSRAMPWLTCSLDAWMIQEGEYFALEFKDVSAYVGQREWDLKQGRAPLKYTIQLQHQLAVTGWNRGYLVALCGFEVTPILVDRHDGIIEAMAVELEEFWRRISERIEPDIDGSDATYDAIRAMFPVEPMSVTHLNDLQSGYAKMYQQTMPAGWLGNLDGDQGKNRNLLARAIGSGEYAVTTDGQWYSFKEDKNGIRKLKCLDGMPKIRG